MSGRWVVKIAPPHTCEMPALAAVGAGSVWECDCGEQYTFTGRDTHGYASWR